MKCTYYEYDFANNNKNSAHNLIVDYRVAMLTMYIASGFRRLNHKCARRTDRAYSLATLQPELVKPSMASLLD